MTGHEHDELLRRLVRAQERIADADERRNDLLLADIAERREAWAREEDRRDEILGAIREPVPNPRPTWEGWVHRGEPGHVDGTRPADCPKCERIR